GQGPLKAILVGRRANRELEALSRESFDDRSAIAFWAVQNEGRSPTFAPGDGDGIRFWECPRQRDLALRRGERAVLDRVQGQFGQNHSKRLGGLGRQQNTWTGN